MVTGQTEHSYPCPHRHVEETGVRVERDDRNPMRSKRRVVWILGRCHVCNQSVMRRYEVRAVDHWQRSA